MAGTIFRARVVSIGEDGAILVERLTTPVTRVRCDVLESGSTPPRIEIGTVVLVLAPEVPHENGCVLGRVGRYAPPAIEPHRVIEAGETLTLKCGESSVDLRKDGKLMIRGNDVLTRARRTQRIKGGTVAIN